MSLLIEFAGFKAHFGGDTHAQVEAALAAQHLAQNVDLYKASHHGSDTSSSLAFMQDLTPALIVISNGSNGSYHHPRKETLDIYRGLSPAPVILQTNRCKLGPPCDNVPAKRKGLRNSALIPCCLYALRFLARHENIVQ